MTTAPTLFDGLNARAGDPDTSKAAAESVQPVRGRMCRQILEVLVSAEPHGMTAYEVLLRLERDGRRRQQSVVSRRLSDLRDAGLIRDSGRRRPGQTGRELIVWVLP